MFDDPIPSYLNTLHVKLDDVYFKKMKGIILNTIKDNIKILENYESNLFILPLRYLSVILNQHYEKLEEIAEKIFCGLFTDIANIEEYKLKILTIEDLTKHLDNHNSASILLFDGDNPFEKWEYRMQKYKEVNDHFDMSKLSSGDIFFISVFGNLRQALALVDMASNFGVIPFIRSFIPLHYYLLLSSILDYNLKPEFRLRQLEINNLKTKVSYFLYREFRKREKNYSVAKLKQKAINIDFETKVFEDLECIDDNQGVSEFIKVLNKYLDEIEKS